MPACAYVECLNFRNFEGSLRILPYVSVYSGGFKHKFLFLTHTVVMCLNQVKIKRPSAALCKFVLIILG